MQLVLQRVLEHPREVLPAILANNIANTRRKIKHPPLWDRPFNQRWNIRLGVPDSLETAWNTQAVKEARDRFEEVCANRVVRDRGDGSVG